MAREKREMSYDDAMEEVIADACEMMLTDPAALNELASDHSSLAKKIRTWLNNFIAKLKKAFTGLEAAHDEAKAMAGYMDELRTMWGSALSDAARGMANKNAAETGDGKAAYSYRGVNDDGIEVYETSAETKKLPYSERVKRYAEIMRNEYRGRTAKFMRNGHAYYALFSAADVRKDAYGDKRSDRRGQRAKIGVGADGNIFELVENARYIGSRAEEGKNAYAHKNVKYWDYFVKQVQIDGRRYDVLANVRKRSDNSYVYSIQVNESKKAPAATQELLSVSERSQSSAAGVAAERRGKSRTPLLAHSITDSAGNVNTEPGKSSARDAAEDSKTAEAYFGRTYRISEAGYLLRNGHMLDFSGRHEGAPGGYRTVDHRDISDAFDGDYGNGEYGDGMIQFMRAGNIRLSPESGGINLSVKPTKSQLETLERYIQSFRGEVMLDIDNEAGDTIASAEYGRGTRASTVLAAINDYFDSGVIPEGTDAKYSLREFEDGTKFVDVQANQDEFDGLSPDDMQAKAREIIKRKFVGKIVGSTNKAFVNGGTANEYAYPARFMNDSQIKEAKMRTSGELGNLLDAGTNYRTEADGADGHRHKNASGGFSYYDAIFKVGSEYYSGVINIVNTAKGSLLKDVTKIRNITEDISSSYGANPKSTFLSDVSKNSIRDTAGKVNTEDKYSMRDVTEGDTKQELEERKKAYAQLRRENAALKKRVEYLKGQTKLTKEATVREADTAALANAVIFQATA